MNFGWCVVAFLDEIESNAGVGLRPAFVGNCLGAKN